MPNGGRSLAHGPSQLWRVGCRSAVISYIGEFYLCDCVMPRRDSMPIKRLFCVSEEDDNNMREAKTKEHN